MPSATWRPHPLPFEASTGHVNVSCLGSYRSEKPTQDGREYGLPSPPPSEAMYEARVNRRPPEPSQDTRTQCWANSVAAAGARPLAFEYPGPTNPGQRGWSPNQKRENEFKEKAESAIVPYLQIPISINDTKGSLAQFAAQITCLFWFETTPTLNLAEQAGRLDARGVQPLAPDALPTIGFLKWVTTMLTTTQVTQNVILLGLLFIYRLKKFNSGVSGKKGSEYRLLTIALMLGNKFLDDNTYTNKTWAEVSGISVSEIHIMEVEFLSNMRYNLYVSLEEWTAWQKQLAQFSIYLDMTSKPASDLRATPLLTPTQPAFTYKLPSPPSPARNGLPSMVQSAIPNQLVNLPYGQGRSPIAHPELDYFQTSRKRSLEYAPETAPKRLMARQAAESSPISPTTVGSGRTPDTDDWNTPPSDLSNLVRVPRLPIPQRSSIAGHPTRLQPYLAPLTVPGNGNGKAMSMVYPVAPSMNSWSQPVTPVGASTKPNNIYTQSIPPIAELSGPQHNSVHSSPAAAGFNNVTTPSNSRQLSPSHFLTYRNSPYRPVRNVNTLLIPPPSASLHDQGRNITLDQMRYQPLTKAPGEPRAGVVPFIHYDGAPQWAGQVGQPQMLPQMVPQYLPNMSR